MGHVDPYQLIEGAVVYGKPGVNLDTLAERINAELPTVQATKPSTPISDVESGEAAFTVLTTATALLALVIGGLSVVNTMIMSVSERVREIGLKKALGARTRHLLTEFLAEAAVMGLIGGGGGFLLGFALTALLDAGDASGGLFLVTPRLTLLAIGFGVALGAGVCLQIEQGEFVAVVGRSGSGKTTMLDCAGLLMRRIHRERRVTFLIVTHDLDLAAKAGRIIHLRDRRLAGDERVESVRSPVAAA